MRIVLKLGTSTLTHPTGNLNIRRVEELCKVCSDLKNAGHELVLVSSGAVAMGVGKLSLAERPKDIPGKQAAAAVGQCELMYIYDKLYSQYHHVVAQLLITADDIETPERAQNFQNTLTRLLQLGTLPIINENDTVATQELGIGDNDTLAGMLASITDSRLTVILTTEQGLRERNEDGTLGKRISVVKELSESVRAMAGGTDNSEFSIGGMSSKLHAAEIVTAAGEYLWIADGREKGALEKVLAGEDIGTVFLPRARRIPGRKRWISFFSRVSGSLLVDEGAAKAVREQGRSLLPSGVKFVSGAFKRGDTVEISGPDGVPFARGLVNFDAADCLQICGRGSAQVHTILGPNVDEEVIHRDNLTLNIP